MERWCQSLHDGMLTRKPPSRVIVAPLTYAPARLARNKAVPPMSSGVPRRLIGICDMRVSPTVSSISAVTVQTFTYLGPYRFPDQATYAYFGRHLKMVTVKQAHATIRQEISTHHRQWYCSISLPFRAVQRGGDSGDEAPLLPQNTHRYHDQEHLDLLCCRSDKEWGFKS